VNASVSTLRLWRAEPNVFVRKCLKAEPDAWQDEVLSAFNSNPRVALCASKGPGKTTVLAWLIWLFLMTRPFPKVPCVSITGENLRDNLWAELKKWQKESPVLTSQFTWTASRVFANDSPEEWWASARQWSKSADATQQSNTLAGTHGEHVLAVADEAGGMPRAVVAAADAVLANGGDTHLLLAGNTTDIDSALGDAVTRERNLWRIFEVNGDPDSPTRAPRVTIEWAREQIEKYGRDHPIVLVNVFGKFPPRSSSKLLGPGDVDDAVRRTIKPSEFMSEPKVIGVDVARFGDDENVILRRQGRAVWPPRVLSGIDTMTLAGQVALEADDFKADAIFVDACGVGAGVADRLIQLGYPCFAVDSAQRPLRPDPRCFNRRAEVWWQMAQWVKKEGCLPNDPKLRAELIGPEMGFNGKNELKLETKEEMKRRGLSSPNRADALSYTFAMPVVPRGERLSSQAARVVSEYDPLERAGLVRDRPETGGGYVSEYDPWGRVSA